MFIPMWLIIAYFFWTITSPAPLEPDVVEPPEVWTAQDEQDHREAMANYRDELL